MIEYRKGYQYQLATDYRIYVGIYPSDNIKTEFLSLDIDGNLDIKSGYAWDGSSGTIDRQTNIRASLVHDALYQLLRGEYIEEGYRDTADKIYRDICIEAGMFRIIAALDYRGLVLLGAAAADPDNRKPILTAP